MRRFLGVLMAIAAAGCGNGGGSSSQAVLSAAFGNLAGANTSGVGISTSTVGCAVVPATTMMCQAFELPDGKGREIDLAISGAVAAGMDYAVGGSGPATITFFDPTTFGTATGLRQWSAIAGTGVVHIDAFDGAHVAFTYGASMQAFGSPATGTFDLSGAANVSPLRIVQN